MGLFILIIVPAAALLVGLVVYKAMQNTGRARLLAGLPWTELGELQPGLVKVQGQVVGTGGPLRAPLSGRDCVYFHFQVQEKRKRGGVPPHGGGSYWKTIINDAQHVPFDLDDGAGTAQLRLQSAELLLSPAGSERSGFLQSARPELEKMLQERYGYSSVGLIFNRHGPATGERWLGADPRQWPLHHLRPAAARPPVFVPVGSVLVVEPGRAAGSRRWHGGDRVVAMKRVGCRCASLADLSERVTRTEPQKRRF